MENTDLVNQNEQIIEDNISAEKILLNKAVSIAERYFEGIKDKSGKPYIQHCLYVMNKGKTIEEKIVGVLHDLFEDCDVSDNDINMIKDSFGKQIFDAIIAITHNKKEENYMEYIKKLSDNKIAVNVKFYDLEHNMLPERNKDLNDKEIRKRFDKYKMALDYLKN